MKTFLTIALLTVATGSRWSEAFDRKEVLLNNNRFIPSIITARAGDTYRVVVPELPPGRYRFFCTPHMNGGMRGELVVVP